jgi:spore maturation protein CgeB
VRFVLFYHSLISDWNHGNAHFLRGVASELQARGHSVRIYEPANGWSQQHLREQHGEQAIRAFLDDADVVLVHEWNDPKLIKSVGAHRRDGGRFRLLFHDTHHRAVSAQEQMRALDLSNYDGVLAFGEVLRQMYEDRGWAARAWTWHEAADVRRFTPPAAGTVRSLDLVWIGNWGDDERAHELDRFLIEPVRALNLKARVYGVRYPEHALAALREAGIEYGGWIPNFQVPRLFAQAAATVHVPRRFYVESLPGIPTIRMFEALACGIPLVSAPWDDCENLFEAGRDYLVATDGDQMRDHLRLLRADPQFAQLLAKRGLRTLRARHTCAHRVDELLSICHSLGSVYETPADRVLRLESRVGLLERSRDVLSRDDPGARR